MPAAALRPLVPIPLTLDTFDGVAYVGLVPFAMERVRPAWVPGSLGLAFLETNVRTYVHLDGRDPGVHFFSLEASSWLAVRAARLRWGLPYFHARMGMETRDGVTTYRSARRGAGGPRLEVRYEPGERLGPSAPGTLEHFLLERYLLYVERSGRLWRGQVHHAPYPAQRARVLALADELVAAAGLPRPEGLPPLAHFAEGVDVEVFPLVPCGGR